MDAFFDFSKVIPKDSKLVAASIFKPPGGTAGCKRTAVYVEGMKRTAHDLPNKLPDWYYRIYYDDSFTNDLEFIAAIEEISALPHVQLVKFSFQEFRKPGQEYGHNGLFGSFVRFHAMFDPNISHVMFRNVNHIFMKDESERILDWVSVSDKDYVFYANPCYTWDPDMFYPYNCTVDREIEYENRFTRAGDGIFDHFIDIIKYKSYKTPSDYPVITRVLAGLFGSKGGRPCEDWTYMTDLLKILQTKPEFCNFAYGIDEIVLTSMFYKKGVLGSTVLENANYLVPIDNQEYKLRFL